MLAKKCLIWLVPMLLLLNGCTHNRIQLFNYDLGSFFGNTPDFVTVQRKDTLYSIARRYNVPIRNLIEANHLYPPYSLQVGQVLKMPNAKYHIVQKGDTIYNLSKRYGVDMSSLNRLNQIDDVSGLRIGQRLVIPGTVVSNATPVPASYNPTPQQAQTSFWKPWSKSDSAASTTTAYTPPPKYRKSKFEWPVRGTIISKYGAIGKGRNNDGINIKAPLGTAVKAADAGTVAYAGNELKGFGNLILVRHNDGWVTAYSHNDRLLVKKGQKVRKGEKIATVGSTGGVNTPQLHFEIRSGKKAVNPMSYLQ